MPQLTNITEADKTATSVTVQCTTNAVAGVAYAVAVPAGSPQPSRTQIMQGVDATGTPAPSVSVAVDAGIINFPAINGLLASTQYDIHCVQNVAPSDYVPAGVLLFDDFNYVVNRAETGYSQSNNPFTINGPWNGAKATQLGEPNADGYLYTVDTIPGYAGQMPGVSGSGRVLCLETIPEGTPRVDTDVFLYAANLSDPNFMPSDVWFQFWMYAQNDPTQPGEITDGKWLYPSRNGYPSNDFPWLLIARTGYAAMPYFDYIPPAGNNVLFYSETPPTEYAYWDSNDNLAIDDSEWKLGHNDANPPTFIPENNWRLVRVHADLTELDSPGGLFEIYSRPMGNPAFTRVARWKHGEIVNGHQVYWPLSNNNGAREFKLFSVFATDFFAYLADFAMAAGINAGGGGTNDLPVYGGY